MSGVANPSSAPVSTALNMFHTIELGKLIICIISLILTALFKILFIPVMAILHFQQQLLQSTDLSEIVIIQLSRCTHEGGTGTRRRGYKLK